MKKLEKNFLDRIPGTKHETEKEYPYLVARNYYTGSLEVCSTEWRKEIPSKLYENDWIPSKLAALICEVSKQAISDRIRRKTLETKPGPKYTSIKLVQLEACRKKSKAGRPPKALKSTTRKPAKHEVKGLSGHQTDIEDLTKEKIRVTGSIQPEQRFLEMLKYYERGKGALEIFNHLEWPEIKIWSSDDKFAVFDSFIDWCFKNKHLT